MTLGDKFLPRGCLELPVDPETSAAKVFFQRPEEYFPKNRRRNLLTSLPASQVGDICGEGLFAGAVIFRCSLPAPLELTHLCRKASSLLLGRVVSFHHSFPSRGLHAGVSTPPSRKQPQSMATGFYKEQPELKKQQ